MKENTSIAEQYGISPDQEPIRILWAEDHSLLGELMAGYIQRFQGLGEPIHFVGQTQSLQETKSVLTSSKIHILLLDIQFKGEKENGFDLLRELRSQKILFSTIVVTAFTYALHPKFFKELGIQGYVLKTDLNFLQAIYTVYRGEYYFSAEIKKQLSLPTSHQIFVNDLKKLRDQEIQTLYLELKGLNTDEIAERLSVLPTTIHQYRYRTKKSLSTEWVSLDLIEKKLILYKAFPDLT